MIKKSIQYILILVLILPSLLLSGCGSKFDEDASNKLEKDVYNIYEELKTVYADSDSGYDVSSYLYNWGKDHKLIARTLSGGNVVITKPASVPDRSLPETVIQCSISKDNSKDASQQAAVALAALINVKENGKVAVLFTMNDNHAFDGAKRLTAGNLDSDYFIHLDSGENSAINTGTAGTSQYLMSLKYKRTPPIGTIGYKITIAGFEGGDSSQLSGSSPNPIIVLSNFITSCRASGLLVELADFEGGKSAATFPKRATITVSVDQTSETKFLTRANASRDKFLEKYLEKIPNLTYAIKKVHAPKSVISSDDSANILSLLYTTINGVYKTSGDNGDGDLIAMANMGKITIGNGKMKLSVLARSTSSSVLKEMLDSYHSTAYLSNASFKVVARTKIWPYSEENPFAKDFITVASTVGLKDLTAQPSFKQSECPIFYEKKKDIDMISFSVTNNDAFLDAKTLIVFLTQLVDES